jgi:dephospho-CoA kinase
MRRNQLSREEAVRRIAAQMSQEEKLRHADFSIDTSEGFEDTRRRTVEVYAALRELAEAEARP